MFFFKTPFQNFLESRYTPLSVDISSDNSHVNYSLTDQSFDFDDTSPPPIPARMPIRRNRSQRTRNLYGQHIVTDSHGWQINGSDGESVYDSDDECDIGNVSSMDRDEASRTAERTLVDLRSEENDPNSTIRTGAQAEQFRNDRDSERRVVTLEGVDLSNMPTTTFHFTSASSPATNSESENRNLS